MKRSNRRKKTTHQETALQRINELFQEAEKVFKDDQSLANRYVQLARKISLKYKVTFSKKQKSQFCKKCKNYLIPGKNCSVRLNKGKKVVKCQNCNNIMRFGYK